VVSSAWTIGGQPLTVRHRGGGRAIARLNINRDGLGRVYNLDSR